MTNTFAYSKTGDDEQAALVAPALINSVQIGISVNTLAPDQPKSFSQKFLKDKYDISNNDSLMRRINQFFYHFRDESLAAPTKFGSATHSTIFTEIVQEYYRELGDFAAVKKVIEDEAYDKNSIVEFAWIRRLDVYVKALDLLDTKGFLPLGKLEFADTPIDAYYDGLTVTLVRMGLGAGYLGDTDGREILKDVLDTTRKQYRSWQEFATGYLLERAGFSDYVLEPLIDIASKCLEKPESPWNKLAVFE
jgi:hypothetical protein